MPTQIDQDGLPTGEPGTSRTDGLAGGELVTLTDTGPDAAAEYRLLWTPPGDAGAVSSLAATGDPKVWTFTPTAGRHGTYLVEHVGTGERVAFVVRTPRLGLIIPALGERGDPDASLFAPGTGELVDNNATDFADPDLNELPFAAWWRAMHELIVKVDRDPFGAEIYATAGFFVDASAGVYIRALPAEGVPAEVALALQGGGSDPPSILRFGSFSGELVGAGHRFIGWDGTGGTPKMAFFGVPEVVRPSITGTTTQEQVDSLVAALAALGLVTDDR